MQRVDGLNVFNTFHDGNSLLGYCRVTRLGKNKLVDYLALDRGNIGTYDNSGDKFCLAKIFSRLTKKEQHKFVEEFLQFLDMIGINL